MKHPSMVTIKRWAPSIVCCLIIGIGLGGFAVYIGKAVALVTAVRESQQSNAPKVDEAKNAAESAKQAVDLLTDCLTPGGKCYEQGQTNQANVLQIVADIVRYTELCNDNPAVAHNDAAIKACVDAKMAAHHGH